MIRRWLLIVAVALGVLLGPAAPAGAHASLLAATPAAGYSVSTSPPTLTLVFDEAVSLRGTPLRLTGPTGPVTLGPARLSHGARWLAATVPQRLPDGRYTVDWQVIADDGDVVAGRYAFGVGAVAVSSSDSGAPATRGLAWAAVLRWVLFAALALGLGGLVGERLARGVSGKAAARGRDLPTVRSPVSAVSVLGAVAALGLSAHLLGSGSVASGLGQLSVPALWGSGAGRVVAVEVAAFVLAAALGRLPRLRGLAIVPLLAVVAAEGWRSHVREDGGGWGIALLIVHLGAAAVWLGALSYVLVAAWRWRARRAAAYLVLAGYARLAIALMLTVVATGTLSAIVVLPGWSALTDTGYGQLLLVKIGLIVAALGLAVAGRRRLALADPLRESPAPATLPGRAPRSERLALGAVLAVTAVLVSVAAPGVASSELALPPPPTGPVVRLASLAGQVTIGIAASDGQLLVHTSAPTRSDNNDDDDAVRTEVNARLGTRPVPLRRCGPGCFVGPAQWAHGTNTLSVTGAAKGWAGGTVAFSMRWPPVIDTRVLGQVVAAMRAVRAVTVHEVVTSNTAAPSPPVTTSTLSGRDFLTVAAEAYRAPGRPPATVLSREDETTVIAVAFADQGYYYRLTLNAEHRITGEVITAPEHLLTRTFDYPRPATMRARSDRMGGAGG